MFRIEPPIPRNFDKETNKQLPDAGTLNKGKKLSKNKGPNVKENENENVNVIIGTLLFLKRTQGKCIAFTSRRCLLPSSIYF